MNDVTVMLVRYALIAFGTYGAAKGWFSQESFGPVADKAQTAIGAVVALGSAAWGVWVASGTARVPMETAVRKDVPTVSPVTGTTIPGAEFTKSHL